MGTRPRFHATKSAVQTPTITAGAYSANDALGGKLTFDILKFGAIGGRIVAVVVTDKAKQSDAVDLILFNQDFTPTADNAAFDPSDADLLNVVANIQIAGADYSDFVDNSAAIKNGISYSVKSEDAAGKLYGQLVTRGTPTYVSTSDIQVRLVIEPDML